METRLDEIGDGIYRISTCVPGITPDGFTFNQFLLLADEPLLFHCGMRKLFPLVAATARRVLPLERLRWISFGHVEADELGAMNEWLAAAPHAQVVHCATGCGVSINDLADRPPRVMADREVLDLGGKRVVLLETPHLPHGWEAIVMHEEITQTLLGGDLLTASGDGPALTRESPLEAVLAAERRFHAWALAPGSAQRIERLAELRPRLIAAMHGSSYEGDGGRLLRELAEGVTRIANERAWEASSVDATAPPP
jgi:flavorubredoxin